MLPNVAEPSVRVALYAADALRQSAAVVGAATTSARGTSTRCSPPYRLPHTPLWEEVVERGRVWGWLRGHEEWVRGRRDPTWERRWALLFVDYRPARARFLAADAAAAVALAAIAGVRSSSCRA
eukprot:gene32722-29560_t